METIRSAGKYIIGVLIVLTALIAVSPVYATSIKVPDMAAASYLRVKESRQIYASVTDVSGKCTAVRFRSSDTGIATVSKSGVIKGKKAGRATITISTKETYKSKGKTKTRTIKKNLRIRVTKYRHIAHRGLQSKAPPNSKKAYQLAGKAHFWGMEADIQESLPDENGNIQIYVCHDLSLLNFCGVDRNLSDMTAEEIEQLRIIEGVNAEKYNQKICKLASFLDICQKYGAVPYLDSKVEFSPQAVRMIVDMLAERGLLKKCRLVGYVDDSMSMMQSYAMEVYGEAPSIILNVNVRTNPEGRTAMEQVAYARSMGYQGVSVNKSAISKKIDKYCRDNGLELNLWSYDDHIFSDNDGLSHHACICICRGCNRFRGNDRPQRVFRHVSGKHHASLRRSI